SASRSTDTSLRPSRRYRERRADATTIAASAGWGRTPGDPWGRSRQRQLRRQQPSSHLREPGLLRRIAAVDGIEEQLLQLRGDRPARAFADRPIVVLANRRHLGSGAGEKRLVGDVEL